MFSFVKNIIVLLAMSASSIFLSPPVAETEQKTDPPVVVKRKKAQPENYPQGAFRNPMGIPMQLVANFGELRPNHYHMGLDIRTMQRENLPVYAAADGYVRKIKIEKSGFGNALYIEHFNGYTTLYAHLNTFYPELAAYIKQQQYHTQKWEQEIEIDPELFPIKQGQFIALSGNTGGSQGPHLHFEIRDTETGNNLNPLLFGFGLPDRTPPSIYRMYYYDRRYSTYQTTPLPIPIKGGGGSYSTLAGIVNLKSPTISFGISADDMITGMHGHVGIYKTELWIDDHLKSGFSLDDISYNETRYLNASIDYKTKMNNGGFIQHIGRLPGNKGNYFTGPTDGLINIIDSNIHRAKIVVKDVSGNTSAISFNFRYDAASAREITFPTKGIAMPQGKENIFETEDCKVMFSPNALYDLIPFVHKSEPANDARALSALHHIADYKYPVHDSFTVQIKPTVAIPENKKDRIVMHLQSNKRVEVEKGVWIDGKVQAKFKYLGDFKLLLDTIAPSISLLGWVNGGSVKGKRAIAFVAKDNIEDVKTINAYLDGQWVLFGYNKGAYFHTFDERTSAGRHELKVMATDEAGNTAERIFSFVR